MLAITSENVLKGLAPWQVSAWYNVMYEQNPLFCIVNTIPLHVWQPLSPQEPFQGDSH